MAGLISRIRNRLVPGISHRFWIRAALGVEDMPKSRLRGLKRDAKQQIAALTQFETLANRRLSPAKSPVLAEGADWTHRVDLFAKGVSPKGHAPLLNATRISDDVTGFTDDPQAQVALRQTASLDGSFDVVLDIFELGGSFLSLAVGLGEAAAKAMKKSDLLRVDLSCKMARETDIIVRLNLRSGPNTEQVTQRFQAGKAIDFDLFYVDFDPDRMSDAWIDIMVAPQRMNQITFHDLIITRLPRAEI